jgi:hypothetical protein
MAINFAIGGLEVRGYHVGNILLHLSCALLAFAALRRILRLAMPAAPARDSTAIAFLASAAWAVHPLQTEVVDYIVARTESLMAVFYLLCIYSAVRAYEHIGERQPRASWIALAIGSAALGMLCKESMATIPLAVVVIDRAMFFPSFAAAWRARKALYIGLCLCWLIVIAIATGAPRASSAGFGISSEVAAEVSTVGYLRNQALILPHYLQLLVWPTNLVLDYGYAVPLKTTDVLAHAAGLVIGGLMIAALWFARPRSALPFVLAILLLAPTTLVPIVSEVGAERRMYLPALAIISGAIAYGGHVLPRRIFMALSAAMIVGLALLSVQRNSEYFSTYGMWKTVVERRPHGRAYLNLAVAANDEGRRSEVLPLLRQAVIGFPDAEFALGERLYQERLYAEAIPHIETFLRVRSTHYQAGAARQLLIRAWTDLAIQRSDRGDLAAAHDAFSRALELDPSNPDLRRNVATSTEILKEMRNRPR